MKRHRKCGAVVEPWETAPEPRALKPQFPGDVAVAGGFIFWQSVPICTGMEGVLIVSGVLSCPPSLLHVSAV